MEEADLCQGRDLGAGGSQRAGRGRISRRISAHHEALNIEYYCSERLALQLLRAQAYSLCSFTQTVRQTLQTMKMKNVAHLEAYALISIFLLWAALVSRKDDFDLRLA